MIKQVVCNHFDPSINHSRPLQVSQRLDNGSLIASNLHLFLCRKVIREQQRAQALWRDLVEKLNTYIKDLPEDGTRDVLEVSLCTGRPPAGLPPPQALICSKHRCMQAQCNPRLLHRQKC